MNYRILVIGLGDGGCKILNGMFDEAYSIKGLSLAAINTDSHTLEESQATIKIQIGSNITKGFGSGGDANIGKRSAESDIEMIESLFAEINIVFLIVCLGGGTGTGAATVILNSARKAGAMTLCLATIPFEFEGNKKNEQAHGVIGDLNDSSDALIIIPNDRLFESVDNTNISETFKKANTILASGIGAIWKLLTNPGYIKLDFPALYNVIKSSGGICTLGYGEGVGTNKAEQAVASVLNNSLLKHGELITNARSLLVSIIGGSDLTLLEVGNIMENISSKTQKNSNIAMGTVIDDSWNDKIAVMIIVSEQWKPIELESIPEPIPKKNEKGRKSTRSKKKHTQEQMQTKLEFEPVGKGRFKNIEPTIMDGEDIDIPTFIRHNIAIDK